MGRVSHENAGLGYKLILVPLENIRTHSPIHANWPHPQHVTVAQDVPYEAIADVAPDKKITMSGVFFDENVEVVRP